MISVALHVMTLVCEQLPLLQFLAVMPRAALSCLDQPSFGITAALACDLVLLLCGPMHEQPDLDGLWIALNEPFQGNSTLQQT